HREARALHRQSNRPARVGRGRRQLVSETPSLRDQAIAAAALDADRARQAAEAKRVEHTETLRGTLATVFGSEPQFVYAETIDYPTEKHQQFGGTYLQEHTAAVTAFDVDGVRFVFLRHQAAGTWFEKWVLETACKSC